MKARPLIWGGAVLLTLTRFGYPAVGQAIQESSDVPSHHKASALERYREAAAGKSNTEARVVAADIIGSQVDWDWDCAFVLCCLLFLWRQL
jgi:hypothetical protein